MSLRNHEESLLGFLLSLGMQRHCARALVATLVKFDDVTECLHDLAEEAERRDRLKDAVGNLHDKGQLD